MKDNWSAVVVASLSSVANPIWSQTFNFSLKQSQDVDCWTKFLDSHRSLEWSVWRNKLFVAKLTDCDAGVPFTCGCEDGFAVSPIHREECIAEVSHHVKNSTVLWLFCSILARPRPRDDSPGNADKNNQKHTSGQQPELWSAWTSLRSKFLTYKCEVCTMSIFETWYGT